MYQCFVNHTNCLNNVIILLKNDCNLVLFSIMSTEDLSGQLFLNFVWIFKNNKILNVDYLKFK